MAVFEPQREPSRFFLRLMGAVDHIDGYDDGEEPTIKSHH